MVYYIVYNIWYIVLKSFSSDHSWMMAYYIAKVLTRRDQLGMRKKKGKGKGDKGKKSDAEDGECDQGSQKRKKPRVAGKKKHGKTNTTKRARKVKGKDSEAEVCDTPDAPGSSKGGQKNAVCKGKAKSKASPKKRGSPKSTRKPVPKASPKKKSRGSKVKPSAGSPSELPGGSAADDVEPGKVKEPMPKRRTRRVATPQAHSRPLVWIFKIWNDVSGVKLHISGSQGRKIWREVISHCLRLRRRPFPATTAEQGHPLAWGVRKRITQRAQTWNATISRSISRMSWMLDWPWSVHLWLFLDLWFGTSRLLWP